MNRKVYSKPSIAVVTMTTTPLLAASGQYNNSLPYGGPLDETNTPGDEPELEEINGTKWYIAE